MHLSPTKKAALPLFLLLLFFCTTVVSFAQNGSLDASFGNGGKVITDFGGTKDYATCMALQPDGKIVVGGYVTNGPKQYFALARYQQWGVLDSSFGTSGKVTTGFDSIKEVFLESIKLQADGKIVAGGYLIKDSNNNFVLVRYKTDGSLDSTFGADGKIITPLNGNNNRATSVEIDADGTIIVSGSIDCKPAVRRYEANGATSLFFAQLGITTPDFADCYHVNTSIVAFTGQVLIGGESQGSSDNMFLMRLDTAGQGKLDSSFGNNGIVKTIIGDASSIVATVMQPDGKIVVAGFDSSSSSNRQLVIVRYQNSGALDSTFGTDGEVKTTLTDGGAAAHSLVLEKNGEIVVTGTITTGTTDNIVALVYQQNGSLDSTFGTNGEEETGNGLGDDAVASVIQPDGKLVVAGYTLSADSTGYNFIVARYNTAQSLPIKLSSFTATAIKTAVALNWTTASELNNSYFTIERGSNTSSFIAIGKVNSEGNSNQQQQYTFTDLQPLPGDNFYRLKQVDNDGKFTYSKVVRVGFGDVPHLKIYPNPAKDMVHVSGLGTGAELFIVDVTGKAIRKAVTTSDDYTLNIQSLATGIYYIRVNQGDKTTILKLLKE